MPQADTGGLTPPLGITALSLVLEVQQVIAGYLISHLIVNIIKLIHLTSIYWEVIMWHIFVLGTKYTAVNEVGKNPHSYWAYNLVRNKISEIYSMFDSKHKEKQ